MLTVEVIMPNNDNPIIEFYGPQPDIGAIRDFVKAQFPTSLGAEYTDT